MIEIIEVEQTSSACPSQWDVMTSYGRDNGYWDIYIRYRSARFTIRASLDPERHPVEGVTLYAETIGDEWDGTIEWDQVLPRLEKALRDSNYPDLEKHKKTTPIIITEGAREYASGGAIKFVGPGMNLVGARKEGE